MFVRYNESVGWTDEREEEGRTKRRDWMGWRFSFCLFVCLIHGYITTYILRGGFFSIASICFFLFPGGWKWWWVVWFVGIAIFLGCFCHELLPYVHHDWHAGRKWGYDYWKEREWKEFSLRMRKKNGRMYWLQALVPWHAYICWWFVYQGDLNT